MLLIILGWQISLGRNRFGALNAAAAAGGPPPRALTPQAREAARRVYSAGRLGARGQSWPLALRALPLGGPAGCRLLLAAGRCCRQPQLWHSVASTVS